MTLPLDGLRIIAVQQYGAGPFATQHLADLGAEVIKIENPGSGGDVGRAVGPHFTEEGDSLFYQSFNRNKKVLRLIEDRRRMGHLHGGLKIDVVLTFTGDYRKVR